MTKPWRTEAERHAFFLSKKVDEAVRDHNMIEDGDRILVAVSGGKDSLSLLRLLAYRLKHSPAKYDLVAAHVRGDARGPGIELPEELVRWVKAEGVPFEVADILLPEGEPLPMDCERCSRNRRKTLFEMAESLGCNKVALGHNLEDFAHTALMNLLQHGRLETMAFRADYFGGRFSLVRPLAHLREHEITRFAKACELPVAESSCPLAATSHRAAARRVMAELGREFRWAAANLVRAASRNEPGIDEEVTGGAQAAGTQGEED